MARYAETILVAGVFCFKKIGRICFVQIATTKHINKTKKISIRNKA
jgi:hypothetical protein